MTAEQKYNRKLVFRVVRTFITIIVVIVVALGYLYLTTLEKVFESEFEKRGDSLCSNLAFNSKLN